MKLTSAPHAKLTTVKMNPTATPTERKQITRNRASYSCQTCRKRKIKCDKVRRIALHSSQCVLTHVFHRFTQSAVTASSLRTNALTARTIVPDLSSTNPARKKQDARPSVKRLTTTPEKARLIIHLHLLMVREVRSPRLHLLPIAP